MDLEIRQMRLGDVEFTNEIRNKCLPYLHTNSKNDLATAINWFKANNPYYFIISVDKERVGYFRTDHYSAYNRNIYIGADIHPDKWGLGIAQKAYKQFIPFLFEELNLNKISLEVLSTNERAIHLYKKLGFFLEGVKRQDTRRYPDTYIDSIIMSILREELPNDFIKV